MHPECNEFIDANVHLCHLQTSFTTSMTRVIRLVNVINTSNLIKLQLQKPLKVYSFMCLERLIWLVVILMCRFVLAQQQH